MEGWFVTGADLAQMQERVRAAQVEGAAAVIVREGPGGDALVLAGALAPSLSEGLLGACVGLQGAERRHPTVLARDMTALDLLCHGRSILCLEPPFAESDLEAVGLCRGMWDTGSAQSEGPHFPVPGAVNRPRPAGDHTPLLALDLTSQPGTVPSGLAQAVDFVLRPGRAPDVCVMERP